MIVARSPVSAAEHEFRVRRERTSTNIAAIVVARPGSRTVGEVIHAIASGASVPGRVLVVTPGNVPISCDSLELPADTELTVDSQAYEGTTNLSQLVNAVSSTIDAEWLWILHDDSVPAADCLANLIYEAERSEKIGAVGPKQLSKDGTELREVGIRATRSARRVPEVEAGERDQGQYDHRRDVIGVGTAGVLVRRAAAEAVGWLDPTLGPYGDGLEFSRRLWLGGWRVVVAPNAILAHEARSFARHDFARRRAAQTYNAVLAARSMMAPLLFVWLVFLGFGRAAVRALNKDLDLARYELTASWLLVMSCPNILRGRRRIARASRVPRSVLRSLEDSPRAVRRARREARRARREARELHVQPDPLALAEQRRHRATTWKLGIFVVVVSAVVSVAATIRLLGGPLEGGALLRDSSGVRDLINAALHGWLPSGDGFAIPIDSLWILLAPFTIGSNLGAVTTAIVLSGAPVAALTAYVGFGGLTRSAWARALGALAWAFAPSLIAAIGYGHTAAVLWHVLAPLLLRAVVNALRGGISALGCAAILGAYMVAAAPATIVLLGIIAVLAIVARRGVRWLWLIIPALGVLAPSIAAARNLPSTWHAIFGSPGAPIVTEFSGIGLLTFNPTAVSLYAAALLGAVALAALLMRGQRIAVGGVMVAAGWGWAVVTSHVTVATAVVGSHYQPARGWTGYGLSLAFLGVIVAIVAASQGLAEDLAKRSFGIGHLLTGIGAMACAVAVVLLAVPFVRDFHGDVYPLASADPVVPAVARASQVSKAEGRTLHLAADSHGIQTSLLRHDGVELHEQSVLRGLLVDDAADASIATAVASLAGDSAGFASAIAEHAVTVVVVSGRDTRERRELVASLNATEGLEYVTQSEVGDFWRVAIPSGRLTMSGGDSSRSVLSATSAVLDSDGHPRTVQLAERADSRWVATLEGEPLEATGSQWHAAWKVPVGASGHLVVEYAPGWRLLLAGAQVLIAFIAIVVAIPRRSRR